LAKRILWGEEFNPEGKIIGIPVKQRSVSDSTQGGKLYPGKVSKVPQEHILASFVGDRSVDAEELQGRQTVFPVGLVYRAPSSFD